MTPLAIAGSGGQPWAHRSPPRVARIILFLRGGVSTQEKNLDEEHAPHLRRVGVRFRVRLNPGVRVRVIPRCEKYRRGAAEIP